MYQNWIKSLYSGNRGISGGRIDVLAVIFKGKKIYNYGFNKYCSGNKMARAHNAWSTHAEMSVLQDYDAEGKTILVYREDYYGNPAMAKPCDICMLIIANSRIKRIIYSVPDMPFFTEVPR